jgi:hypothetical protein
VTQDTLDVDRIKIRGIPKDSKLILLGDWFQQYNSNWQVVCYFLTVENQIIRKAMAVDMLPTLIVGARYPRETIENVAQGWTGTFKVPSMKLWKKYRYENIP